MVKIFQYNNVDGSVELNTPEILLVSEFSALMEDARNICDKDKSGKLKLRALESSLIYILLLIGRVHMLTLTLKSAMN